MDKKEYFKILKSLIMDIRYIGHDVNEVSLWYNKIYSDENYMDIDAKYIQEDINACSNFFQAKYEEVKEEYANKNKELI